MRFRYVQYLMRNECKVTPFFQRRSIPPGRGEYRVLYVHNNIDTVYGGASEFGAEHEFSRTETYRHMRHTATIQGVSPCEDRQTIFFSTWYIVKIYFRKIIYTTRGQHTKCIFLLFYFDRRFENSE